MSFEGKASGEIDPHDPLNKVIQDIDLAPRNAQGLVSYSTDISILTPVDPGAGNRTMLLNIVNRGNRNAYSVSATGPPGDGFELVQGFTLVFVGWQADLSPFPGLVTMSAPIAHEHNGRTITGVVRSEFTPNGPGSTKNIVAGSSTSTAGYPTASLDNRHDTMTMRVQNS